jgi:sugar (pentulose or hexulose) kinase
MLAAEQGSLEQICTRPKISEVLEPQPSLVMHYQEKQEQYGKIYRSLEDFF